jgi:hypothetical protein
MAEKDSTARNVDPSWSWRSILFPILVTIISSGIAGIVGYYFNDLTRDRKILEVSSVSSGNLASVPVSVAGNLEILFPVSPTRKETIKSLFRYDVKVSNRAEQGADNVVLVLEPPEGVELVKKAEITTIPPGLVAVMPVKEETTQTGNPKLTIPLMNGSNTVAFGYLGFARNELLPGGQPLKATVVKKDWAQQDISEVRPEADWKSGLFLALMAASAATMSMFGLMITLYTRRDSDEHWRDLEAQQRELLAHLELARTLASRERGSRHRESARP